MRAWAKSSVWGVIRQVGSCACKEAGIGGVGRGGKDQNALDVEGESP